MSVDFIFKIAAIGMIVAVLNTLLVRSGREDQAMLTTLAGVIVVLMMLVPKISALFSGIKLLCWSLWPVPDCCFTRCPSWPAAPLAYWAT